MRLGLAGEAMGLVGAGMSAFFGARNQQVNLRLQARGADIEARTADLAARAVLFAGQQREQAVRLRGAQLHATQRVAFAARGMDLSSQTVMDTLAATDFMTDVDAATVASNAMRAAWGHRLQAVNQGGAARMQRLAARQIQPGLLAGATLLTGAADIGRRWQDMRGDVDIVQRGQLETFGDLFT